jgi:hypothetical protein
MRVLDLDLDFFLDDAAMWRSRGDGRLDDADFRVWPLEDALAFLVDRCGLTGRRSGFVVEHHGELFACWRSALDAGLLRAPFHVTHVDAHADLGEGDLGHRHLLGDLLFREPAERLHPGEHLQDSNYLAFAVGCRWLSDLDYVTNCHPIFDDDPRDVPALLMENFDPRAGHLELPAIAREQFDAYEPFRLPTVTRRDPRVPLRRVPWRDYQASAPFDLVCLARSPEYTPASADALFDEIHARFITPISHV